MKRIFPFCYKISSGSLTANGGTNSPTLTTDSESDFLLRSIRASGNTSVTVQIALVSGEQFTNGAILTSLIGSNNNNGIPVFDDVLIPKGSQITFIFTNNDSSAHTEEIQLWGVKVPSLN